MLSYFMHKPNKLTELLFSADEADGACLLPPIVNNLGLEQTHYAVDCLLKTFILVRQ